MTYRLTPLLASLAALGLVSPAVAQTENLDDFVVSATRQARDPLDVPASVDKINQDTLEKAASFQVNLSETLTRVPGLVINNRNNFAQDLQISIRGFGARATSGVRGVRLFSDGIPATMPDGSGQISHFSLSSTESIEVLRGPFSSLYGNSSGGVILLTTENPRVGTELEVNQIFGSDSTRRSGIKLNKGNGEVGIVIDASTFRTDGYRDHSKARRDNFNSKMVWNLSSDTRLSWVVNYVDIPLAQDPAGLTAAQLAQNRRQGSPASVANNSNKTVEQSQTGIVLEHQFNPSTSVTFSPYYGDRKIRQVLASQTVIDLKNEYSGADLKFAHQANLLEKPLFLTAGLTVGELEQARLGFANVNANSNRDEANTASQFDQYLQAEYFLTDRLSMLAGVRSSSIEIESRDQFLTNGDGSGNKKYDEVTSNLGFTFRLQPNISTYVSYGEGFETPTLLESAYLSAVNPMTNAPLSPNFNSTLDAAKSEQFEVGMKAKFGNTKVNAALYTVDTENEIVVLQAAGGATAFRNAGPTSREGIEFAVQHALSKEWQANAAVNLIRATYDSSFDTIGSTNDIVAGNSLPSIPEKTFFGEVVFKPSSLYEAATELRYVDKLFANDANTAFAPSYSVVNLRASKDWPLDGGWNVRTYARVDNVFDKQYVGSVIVNQGAGQFFEPASERQLLLGVTLGMKWK
ncbi:iron complex outermembrane receptor protein [Limnobacter thiooxidans]|uniref:TonB-dependent receptor n=1 Tax=Limnobacter thiooxidans TaxID=131080 RepID=A0AA86M8X4_9BURK|nr:iron complex outermembrane receptor protein [Limnobacter thiooxidans]BET26834.1 TonB-dependent receptor [Limnobacter thiooxidans]